MKCDGISKGHKHEMSRPFLEFDFVFTNTVKCTLPIFIYCLNFFFFFSKDDFKWESNSRDFYIVTKMYI